MSVSILPAEATSPAAAPRQADRRSTPARDWMRALEATARIAEHPTRTLPVVIGELGQRFGDKPA
ncbi:MAG: hypothetical protein ABSE69_20105, partial [Roseiarcus sp.]